MSNSKLLICLSFLIGFIGLLTLVSCSKQEKDYIDPIEYPNLVDQSWLNGQPCFAPCWQGLEPGISSRESSIDVVQKLSLVNTKGVVTNTRWVNYPCEEPPNRTCVSLEFDNDILNELILTINYRITVEQIVAKIGPPDSFYFAIANPDDWTSCNIELLWIKKQIEISAHYRGDQPVCESFYHENGKFPKDIEGNYISFLRPGEIEKIIDNVQVPDATGEVYMPWIGFAE